MKIIVEKELYAFDDLRILFYKDTFDHAFFESKNRRARDKSQFSIERAKRMSFLKAGISDGSAERYYGWDRDRRIIDKTRRVTIYHRYYIIVVSIHYNQTKGSFITAYPGDARTLTKIRSNGRWGS